MPSWDDENDRLDQGKSVRSAYKAAKREHTQYQAARATHLSQLGAIRLLVVAGIAATPQTHKAGDLARVDAVIAAITDEVFPQ